MIQPVFNEANLLARLEVWLERPDEPDAPIDPARDGPCAAGIAHIAYNAKGQRLRIDYRNASTTRYHYDPLTFRLARMTTRRAPGRAARGATLQDLRYSYDPVGNLIAVRDATRRASCFRNARVAPGTDYVYDALYRLVRAGGREHLGQQDAGAGPGRPGDSLRVLLDQADDGAAMGAYTEDYLYDEVGNFLELRHRGGSARHRGWTRHYHYEEPGTFDDSAGSRITGNRLSRTWNGDGGDTDAARYRYDAHGNAIDLPQLGGAHAGTNLDWDYRDRMTRAGLGGGGEAWYVYDAAGERVRKVWEKAPGCTEERIYLDGFELLRRHAGPVAPDGAVFERATLHLLDDTRRIALIETRTRDTAHADRAPRQAMRYQLGDHLGSVSLELDEDADIVSCEEYAPYGQSTCRAVRSATETASRYRFTGKEHDEETGLSYFGARYYAPWLGRWTSCDPKLSADPYVYCRCNPATLVDPDGREATFANRLWGGVRALGGAAQALVGAAVFVQIEVPVAAQVVGGIAVVHGVSDMEAGFRQMITGREERSVVEESVTVVARAAGAERDTARAIGTGVDIGLGFVSPAPVSGGPRMGYARRVALPAR
ncbi:RHS repeat-associated core domain-containing protein [Massilia sp. Se16.2.3]|uniref:RHS repeat-associated core domain-containing protein n=1 Tax=Massilia sp. Se16.2.3 TaxID=2709303 RepID=UPI001603A370|nr:RHS repeat-associated core domain-containing protein [Massilia sp. Se16.2.3]QNB00106.1 RHS repeat-associated core domain-containing protein [Massilia sp. Se16.2.3]